MAHCGTCGVHDEKTAVCENCPGEDCEKCAAKKAHHECSGEGCEKCAAKKAHHECSGEDCEKCAAKKADAKEHAASDEPSKCSGGGCSSQKKA